MLELQKNNAKTKDISGEKLIKRIEYMKSILLYQSLIYIYYIISYKFIYYTYNNFFIYYFEIPQIEN